MEGQRCSENVTDTAREGLASGVVQAGVQMRPIATAIGIALGIGFVPAASAATLTVLNTADNGAGSLRNTVAAAAAGDTINFAGGVTGTITLTTGQITINKSLTITGPGAAALAISGNNASRLLYIDGTSVPTITISGLTFRNGNVSGNGAAIEFDKGDGTLNVQNSVFTQNTATNLGGAISMYCNACSISISDSTFTANSANDGGAIGTENGNNFTVTRCTINGNTAANRGGGIFEDDTVMLVTDSTFSGNTAPNGGGLFLYFDTPATIRNSTFSGNTATSGKGGGIYFYGASNPVALQNSTIAGNTGSGIFLDIPNNTSLTMSSTIVFGSTGFDVDGLGAGPTFAGDHSLVGTVAAGTVITGAGNIQGQNPLLGPLASNGGPTQTRALLAGSPAIDKGSNPAALANDQRGTGFVRTSGGGTDIGAFEVQGASGPAAVPALAPAGLAALASLLGGAGIAAIRRRRRSGR
jgi:parallel beta-helix repeat protein/predicted outer membrane repeat protein